MTEIRNFTQPDSSPAYFIEVLELLDGLEGIRNIRSVAASRMKILPG